MTKTRISTLALLLTAGLALSACETVQGAKTDMASNLTSIKTALENFSTAQPGSETQMASMASNIAPAAGGSSNCPDVRIVQDLNQVHQFIDAGAPAPAEAVSSVRMLSVQNSCKFSNNNVAVDMTLAFEGSLGPKGRRNAADKPSFAYPYFVAITNNQGSIIAKEVFAVTMAYDGKQVSKSSTEQIRQMIPMNGADQKNYKVLIGFQLNDQELAFNRTLPQDTVVAQTAAIVEAAIADIEPAAGEPIKSPVGN
jgi:predicted small secreted protein